MRSLRALAALSALLLLTACAAAPSPEDAAACGSVVELDGNLVKIIGTSDDTVAITCALDALGAPTDTVADMLIVAEAAGMQTATWGDVSASYGRAADTLAIVVNLD